MKFESDERIIEVEFTYEKLSEALREAADYVAAKEASQDAVPIEQGTDLFAVESIVVDYDDGSLRLYVKEWWG